MNFVLTDIAEPEDTKGFPLHYGGFERFRRDSTALLRRRHCSPPGSGSQHGCILGKVCCPTMSSPPTTSLSLPARPAAGVWSTPAASTPCWAIRAISRCIPASPSIPSTCTARQSAGARLWRVYYSAAHGLFITLSPFSAPFQHRDSEWIHWDHEYVEIIQTLEDNASLIAAAVEAGEEVKFWQLPRHFGQYLQTSGHDRHQGKSSTTHPTTTPSRWRAAEENL